MGCATSKQRPSRPSSVRSSNKSSSSVAAANLKAMQRNESRGKDRMGHDKDIPRVTPGTPEEALLVRHMEAKARSNIGFLGSGMAAAAAF